MPVPVPLNENHRRMLAGELYTAFVPELIAIRSRCQQAVNRYNDTRDVSRRHRVKIWREYELFTSYPALLFPAHKSVESRKTTDHSHLYLRILKQMLHNSMLQILGLSRLFVPIMVLNWS